MHFRHAHRVRYELLYDGGFGVAYDRMSESVGHVLEEAFRHGRDRYHWLYGPDNNYDWYRPRDPVLVDVLAWAA